MAQLPHMNKFLNYPSHFPYSLPNFSLLRPRLSLFPTLCSSPNLLLLSTSVQSDGSLVFKFGDTSEIPPVVENGDVSDEILDDVEIEVELEAEIDDSLAVNDQTAISVSNIENGVEVEIESKYSAIDVPDSKAIVMESASDAAEVELGNIDLVVTSDIKYSDLSDGENTVNDNDFSGEDSKLDVIAEKGFHVENLDNEATLKDEEIEDEGSVKEMIKHDVDEVVEEMEESSVQLEATLEDEESVKEMIKHDVDGVVEEMEVSSVQLEATLEAEEIEDEESVKEEVIKHDVDEVVEEMEESSVQLEATLEDEETVDEESVKEEMIKHDVDEIVEEMEASSVQLQVETVLDEEVNNNAGSPSIAELEDLSTNDSEDAAFPSLEESEVTSTEAIADSWTTPSVDISTLSLSMSSASASVSRPSTVNDAVPLAVQQSDDRKKSRDVSEPAGPGPNSSGTVSAETILDSVLISTPVLSAPSTTAVSLPEAIKVNDADAPSKQLSDDDLSSDIRVGVHQGPGITVTAEISSREEISRPSFCLVSAVASIAHSAEALAGGDDAYFVYENWFGVADGIGQWSFGGIDKGLYAQEFIQNCERLARKNMNTGLSSFKELLQQSAAMTASSGAASILIAHVADQVLHVANIGDSGFIIIRNRAVFVRSSPMCHEFNFPCAISSGDNPVEVVEEYHVELEQGDIIITATDGLFDNLYEHEIVYSVCKAVEDGQNLKDIAEFLALRSQEVGRSSYVRTPFADAAQAAGHPEFSGGKFDHVTVIVSAVQTD